MTVPSPVGWRRRVGGRRSGDAALQPGSRVCRRPCDATYPYLHGERHHGQVPQQVQRLKGLTNAGTMIYPGQSGIVPAGTSIDYQIDYIEAVRSSIREVAKGRPQLTDAERQQFLTLMKRFEPTINLEFVILLGADAVAKKLGNS